MPLQLDIKRLFSQRSDRVKGVDLHPTEPWLLTNLYNGHIYLWNINDQSLVKSFEVTDLPVRTAKFVARKQWIACGADDMFVRVYNYNTMDKVKAFEAHTDYIRSITVHPTLPYLLTSSDDMLIKLWDWDKGWSCTQVFEGHSHYVMQVALNPKDTNTFASASLDRTVKVWTLSQPTPSYTLEGHEKGVNCLDYFTGGDRPYLVSGADDKLVKVWDYQTKACVQTLEGHAHNVSAVSFHPELPVIISGSEDGTVRIWHSTTYRLENTLNYGLERCWTVSAIKGSNNVALGYDEGTTLVKIGREEPVASMESSGKIIWARHNEIQTVNVKSLGADSGEADGERLPLAVKDLGSCDLYPQSLQHNAAGRFVTVCGDGEYIIYTALAWRNKSFGTALEFVWGSESNDYAVRESGSSIKLFKNFRESNSIRTPFTMEGIHGGALLAVRGHDFVAFYDWGTAELVRRIDVTVRDVRWSDSGELVAILAESSFYILRYDSGAVEQAREEGTTNEEDGIEEAFELLSEVTERVRTGGFLVTLASYAAADANQRGDMQRVVVLFEPWMYCQQEGRVEKPFKKLRVTKHICTGLWVGDCFIYNNSAWRLNYCVGGEVTTMYHLDRPMYLLGYLASQSKVYLIDKEFGVVCYVLGLSLIEYKTLVMRGDMEAANQLLPSIPKDQMNSVARFLEGRGLVAEALEVATDSDYRFELAVQLGELEVALDIAETADSEGKWRQLSELAMSTGKLEVAAKCLQRAKDLSGLLLLHSAKGSAPGMGQLVADSQAQGKANVAFLGLFLMGKLDECVDLLVASGRVPEAAFLARTYVPSRVSEVVQLWRKDLAKINPKAAESLADPAQYANLFPDMDLALKAERAERKQRASLPPAAHYPDREGSMLRDLIEEVRGLDLGEDGDVPMANGDAGDHAHSEEQPAPEVRRTAQAPAETPNLLDDDELPQSPSALPSAAPFSPASSPPTQRPPQATQAGGFDAFAGVLSGGQEAAAASQGSAAFDDKEDLFADAQLGAEAASHSELFGDAGEGPEGGDDIDIDDWGLDDDK